MQATLSVELGALGGHPSGWSLRSKGSISVLPVRGFLGCLPSCEWSLQVGAMPRGRPRSSKRVTFAGGRRAPRPSPKVPAPLPSAVGTTAGERRSQVGAVPHAVPEGPLRWCSPELAAHGSARCPPVWVPSHACALARGCRKQAPCHQTVPMGNLRPGTRVRCRRCEVPGVNTRQSCCPLARG